MKYREKLYTIGLAGVASKFVWENTDSFPASQETFCDVHGPQFDTAELDTVSSFAKQF
jgi:hypothetical protein